MSWYDAEATEAHCEMTQSLYRLVLTEKPENHMQNKDNTALYLHLNLSQ